MNYLKIKRVSINHWLYIINVMLQNKDKLRVFLGDITHDTIVLVSDTIPINIGFVGVGGGGNKMANAFIELGFNKTLLVNTTGKDIPKIKNIIS